MLVDQLTIADGAGAWAILATLLIVVTLAVVIVLPRWAICCGSPKEKLEPSLGSRLRYPMEMPRAPSGGAGSGDNA